VLLHDDYYTAGRKTIMNVSRSPGQGKWLWVQFVVMALFCLAVGRPVYADQVIPDDLIVQGSIGVGFDATNGLAFGFDTIILRENNLRILFDDTSTSASFPKRDWRLIANDSANGGQEKFSIEDVTAGRIPFTIEGNAPSNSLYVEDDGDVGIGTSTPVVNLHVVDGNTPTLRLEQNGTSGFTPQTWDVAGNEANFFIRDVTGGSRLSFRIRPGAPTSSIDVAADGDIGLGIAAPDANAQVHIRSDNTNGLFVDSTATGANPLFIRVQTPNGAFRCGVQGNGDTQFGGQDPDDNLQLVAGGAAKVFVSTNGRVGIGNTNPQADLDIGNAGTFSRITAGGGVVTGSSRTLKENIQPVKADDILEKVASVPVVTYDWKPTAWGGAEEQRKNKMGLIAEDFHTILSRGSDKEINAQDVEMTLWLAVQQLHAENQELKSRLTQLEQQAQAQDKP
jgi:hypothetical protein